MPMVINTNIAAVNKIANNASEALAKSMEKLSAGERINSAKDDAAGLSVAARLSAQVSGMNVAQRNTQNGISLAQTADGALDEINDILTRMRELATQGASTSASSNDQKNIATEYNAQVDAIDRIAKNAQFNGKNLLDGSGSVAIETGPNSPDSINISLGDMTASGLGLSKVSTDGADFSSVGTQVDAASAMVNIQKSVLQTTQSTLVTTATALQTPQSNLDPNSGKTKDTELASDDAASVMQQVVSQTRTPKLAQANQPSKSVLNLLR